MSPNTGRSFDLLSDELVGFLQKIVQSTLGEGTTIEIRLAAAVDERHPKLPVILVSGYGALLTNEQLDGDAYTSFLSKPFQRRQLGEALREFDAISSMELS